MGELCPRPEHYSILFSCTQYLDWPEQTAGQRLGVELDYFWEDLFEYVHQSEREVPFRHFSCYTLSALMNGSSLFSVTLKCINFFF